MKNVELHRPSERNGRNQTEIITTIIKIKLPTCNMYDGSVNQYTKDYYEKDI